MAIALIFLLGLATWRVTRMLWAEHGPLDAFARFRAYLASRQKRMGGLYDMISCFQCLSVWIAMLFSLFIADGIIAFILLTLALSAIAIFVNELFNKLQ